MENEFDLKSYISKNYINKKYINKEGVIYGSVLLIALLLMTVFQRKEVEIQEVDTVHISTFIPRGQTLVSIEIENSEILDSFAGNNEYVHVYFRQANSKLILLGKNIKLLRAPLNPSAFALLLPDEEAKRFSSLGNRFTVHISSRDGGGTEFVRTRVSAPPPAKIIYGVIHDDDI